MQYLLTKEEYEALVPLAEHQRALAEFYEAHGKLLARGQAINESVDIKNLYKRVDELEAVSPYLKMARNILKEIPDEQGRNGTNKDKK